MGIYINNEENVFHLYNKHMSYIMHELPDGGLGHLYFGPRLKVGTAYDKLFFQNHRVLNPYTIKDNPNFSLSVAKQELPVFGRTDFRQGALEMIDSQGCHVYDFRIFSVSKEKGKPMLEEPYPQAHCHEDQADSLKIELRDHKTGITIIMTYTVFANVNAITRSMKILNPGLDTHIINKALSINLDMEANEYDMIHLSGTWSRERHMERHNLGRGIRSIGSIRGASSAQHNPFFALCEKNTTENQGTAYGFNLVYSGNFLGQVEVNEFDQIRVQLGIHPDMFRWELKPGSAFQVPEAVMMYSNKGLNGLSQASHYFILTHILPKTFAGSLSPVLANNWEATYFNFDENSLLALARKAKDLGVDLFVMDDGWFLNRNDDYHALGDWITDSKKFPRGLKAFVDDVKALGLKFGIWIEPEMANEASKLNEEHPEWIVHTPGRSKSYGRHQWVLDYANADVVDHIFSMLSDIFDEIQPDYVKWDMNRYITESYSPTLSADRQGEFYHRYILGVYSLYKRLTERYPNLLFESCASGGGRFDLGMLAYAPQTWTSDNTDAIERLKIQYGTSLAYPLRTMGAHVSAVPNHQVLREASMKTRHNVAMFGTFGYELNLLTLSSDEELYIRQAIDYFKDHQVLIQEGIFYRLLSPFRQNGNNWVAWIVVSQDRSEALLGVFQVLQEPNQWIKRIPLVGLDEHRDYHIDVSGQIIGGDLLMNHGLVIDQIYSGQGQELEALLEGNNKEDAPIGYGDFSSQVYYLKARD